MVQLVVGCGDKRRGAANLNGKNCIMKSYSKKETGRHTCGLTYDYFQSQCKAEGHWPAYKPEFRQPDVLHLLTTYLPVPGPTQSVEPSTMSPVVSSPHHIFLDDTSLVQLVVK